MKEKGFYRVNFKNLIVVDVMKKFLYDCMKKFDTLSEKEKIDTMASVMSEINKAIKRIKIKDPDFKHQDYENLRDDIGIWFTYEYMNGNGNKHLVKEQ